MLAFLVLFTSTSTRTFSAPVHKGAELGYQPASHLLAGATTEPTFMHVPAMTRPQNHAELQTRLQVLSVALMILLGIATGVCGYLVYHNRKLRMLWVQSHRGSMPMASGVSLEGELVLVAQRLQTRLHRSDAERKTTDRFLAGGPVTPEADSISPTAKSRRLYELYVDIMRLFEEEKLYLDPDLSAWKLARILGTNTTYVSACISMYKKENFNSLLNFYRIREACERIEEHIHSTVRMDEIMEASGYRSTSTFYRAFNEFTKMTPKAYLEQKRENCTDLSLKDNDKN